MAEVFERQANLGRDSAGFEGECERYTHKTPLLTLPAVICLSLLLHLSLVHPVHHFQRIRVGSSRVLQNRTSSDRHLSHSCQHWWCFFWEVFFGSFFGRWFGRGGLGGGGVLGRCFGGCFGRVFWGVLVWGGWGLGLGGFGREGGWGRREGSGVRAPKRSREPEKRPGGRRGMRGRHSTSANSTPARSRNWPKSN